MPNEEKGAIMQITQQVMEWILLIACVMGALCALAIAHDLFKDIDQ